MSEMTLRKYWRRARAGLGLAGFVAAAGASLPLPRHWRLRRWCEKAAWACLLRGFAISIRCHGRSMAGGGLYVANHVSWTDIAVIGRLIDAGFVAKEEVRGWPVIGMLTAAYGCLFVDRNRRAAVREQAGAVALRMEQPRGLVLFAEGTTGLGDKVLPMRSSLFAMVAGDAAGQVQPITIRYVRADGTPLSPTERRAVAWIDDDDLAPHAVALADRGGVLVDVWFEPPLASADYASRKALALACEAVIARRLA